MEYLLGVGFLYLEFFKTFFKIGAFTFGGGYAMVPIIQQEIVDKRSWITNDEFLDALSIAQATPGILAVNLSIFVGYEMKGARGALVCLLGTILPSFLIILSVAMFFHKFRDNVYVDKFFLGVRPAIVALIASAVVTLMRKSKLSRKTMLAGIGITLILIILLKVSQVWIILGSGFLSILYHKHIKKAEKI